MIKAQVVREAVALVSKFFLQNLQTLQRHDCFGQLWPVVPALLKAFKGILKAF